LNYEAIKQKERLMGFFTAVTGQDYRDEEYLKTLNYCLGKIRDKADEMGVNLNDYYNTSNDLI
jgi:hypothetical protein